jgi:8-oxo-dGTP pyrophosphatase MutT (NUDIX family)
MNPLLFTDRLQTSLFPIGQGPTLPSKNQQAAVLAPLYHFNEEWYLLFTQRTDHIGGAHAGQVSFPGGKPEYCDHDLLETALRETEEEIGVYRQSIRILGELTTFPTGTGYQITPFVAQIPWPCMLKINPAEVAAVFSVPVNWFTNPANLIFDQQLVRPDLAVLPFLRYTSYQKHLIWGATAWITYELMQIILGIMNEKAR